MKEPMANTSTLHGQKTQRQPAVAQVDIFWLTAGLGCDGDSISITAATQPSIEDLILGAIPGLPKVELHHPVLAYENGDDFLQDLATAAADGQAGAVHPRRRRIDSQRKEQERRLLGGDGDR